MQKTYIVACAALLLLVGAGCNTSSSNEDTARTNIKDAADTMTDKRDAMDTDTSNAPTQQGDISLSAETRASGSVYFAWELAEGDTYDGFVLVRSEKANPEHTGKHYWFRQHYTRRAVTWTELPPGDWHVRICGLQDEECVAYSNDVMISVK